MSRIPLYVDTDRLLDTIERVMLRGRGAGRIPDRLWNRLGELADAVGYRPDPPETYGEAHGYVFSLQRRAQERERLHSPSRRSRSNTAAHATCRYHAARVSDAMRWDPGWAFLAWQAAADDAKRWPSVDRVRVSREAWEHYWQVLDLAADGEMERAA